MSELLRIVERAKDRPPRGANHGWVYVQKESGVVFRHLVLSELMKQIKAHREANGYNLSTEGEGWEAEVEDWMCRNLQIEDTHCGQPKVIRHEPSVGSVSWRQVEQFVHTIRNWWTLDRFSMETEEEANRRADICATCPMNVRAAGCVGCLAVLPIIHKMLSGKSVRDRERLKHCGVCGCSLQLKVWVPREVLKKSMHPDVEQNWPKDHPCWMKGFND